MINKKKSKTDLELSVTDAVLKCYDKGTTSPPAILAALMFSFPTLTLATVRNILHTHRKPKNTVQKEEAPKPKTPMEQLRESILSKCQNCEYHQAGRPCVMPKHLCPFPEMDEDCKRLQQMRAEARAKKGVIKVSGGHITYTKRPRLSNIFDEVERELDEALGEKTVKEEFDKNPYRSSGPIDSTLDDACFIPEESESVENTQAIHVDGDLPEELQKSEDEWELEDFADVVSPSVLGNEP